ncbi:MAG: hypothetical protein HKN14_04525 [Marinicaulis sp.]|nr:hypothetical protein [Marinicaulis sp.]
MLSTSYTASESQTFSVTHARRLASKVRTDLMRIHRFYDGRPSIDAIDDYEDELIALLRDGYLEKVTYGFKRAGKWVAPTVSYTAEELLFGSGQDDRPGAIGVNEDVSGASFYSYLIYSDAWSKLSPEERDNYRDQMPFRRGGANAPGVEGYFISDKSYSAGGRALSRSSLRSF